MSTSLRKHFFNKKAVKRNQQIQISKIFNPFIPNTIFLYLLKTSENLKAFCFQGVEKGCIGNKWVKNRLILILRFIHPTYFSNGMLYNYENICQNYNKLLTALWFLNITSVISHKYSAHCIQFLIVVLTKKGSPNAKKRNLFKISRELLLLSSTFKNM